MFHDVGRVHPPALNIRASTGCALAVTLALAAPVLASGKPVVAVLPLRVLGVSPQEVRAIEAALSAEVAALPEVVPAKPDVVAAELKREPGCAAQIACAAGAAAKAGARQFIAGTVSGLGDTYMLDLKLIDARTGQELRRATHPVSGREERLMELVRTAVVELLAHGRYVGRLNVQVANDAHEVARGAQVFLDGKLRGELPLKEPLSGIPPGQHTLRVAKGGFLDATLFVEVRYDETTEARLDLAERVLPEAGAPGEPAASTPGNKPAAGRTGTAAVLKQAAKPPPPFVLSTGPEPEPADPWLKIAGWSSVGVGVAAVVTGVAFQAKAFSTASDLNQRSATNRLTAADLSAYDDVAREMRTARVLYLIGGLTAATGVTLLIWDHVERQKVEVSAAPLPGGGGALSLAGRF
jgi:PEGA domain